MQALEFVGQSDENNGMAEKRETRRNCWQSSAFFVNSYVRYKVPQVTGSDFAISSGSLYQGMRTRSDICVLFTRAELRQIAGFGF